MKRKLTLLLAVSMAVLLSACQSESSQSDRDSAEGNLSGTVPDELEYIPDEYKYPAGQAGTLEKLTYQTWESFSYEDRTQELTKEAWVYLPYGYSEEQKYNVCYLSHGGWSNETTIMGTDEEPHTFKYVIDHAIQDGKIQPLIIHRTPAFRPTGCSCPALCGAVPPAPR